jgi:hypothetical protein
LLASDSHPRGNSLPNPAVLSHRRGLSIDIFPADPLVVTALMAPAS